VVGLGNPGREYVKTPHNAGFLCVDELCSRWQVDMKMVAKTVWVGRTSIAGEDVILAKPATYMNESGRAIALLRRHHEMPDDRLLVVYDDVDLPMGTVRVRASGSAGTHKGMKSVIAHLGSKGFPRIRVGIAPLGGHAVSDLVSYVLSPLRGKTWDVFMEGIGCAADAVVAVIEKGIAATMNETNRRNNSLLLETEAAKP